MEKIETDAAAALSSQADLKVAVEHHRAGRLAEAEAIYRSILASRPRHAEALCLLGVAALQRKEHPAAIDLIGRAIAIDDAQASFHFHLGNAQRAVRQLETAAACYRRALAIDPQHVASLLNLGHVLRRQGRLEDAAASYRRVIELRPRRVEAHRGLARVLQMQGKLTEAVASYRTALDIDPAIAAVHNDLAGALAKLGRMDEAVGSFRRALAIDPSAAVLHVNLGTALMAQGSLPEAIASFECALEIRTDDPATELSWLHLRQQIGHWEGVADAFGRVRAAAGRSTEPAPSPFWFLAVPGSTPAEQRRCAEVWGRAVAESVQATRLSPAQESDRGAGRIRLGYLSSDLNEHAVATVIAEVIELHDRHRFEVVGYSYGSDDGSAARRRLVRAFDRFVDVRPLSFVDAARHIREDGIDILIDLNGYTRHARTEIVALRPAPVQVSHLGYPGTMGAEFIDYLISDFFVTPPEAAGGYSEALAVLPDCYQPQDRQRPIGDPPPRATCGLPEDGFVFCCFNQPYKIAPDIFDVWCRLLQTVPGSVLWLWKANPWIEGNLRGAAAARGIAPDRLVFADYAPLAEHLARQQLADLFLDTFPYNAHATASHALWAGVPIVTRAGQTFASRVAGSLLRAAGLPELVTRTLDEYFQLSLNLATDRMALGRLRDRLAANRLTAPLFDTLRYVRNLEALYAEMHRRRVAGEAVRSIKPVASGSA